MQDAGIRLVRDATVEERVAAFHDQIAYFRKQLSRDRIYRRWLTASVVAASLAAVAVVWGSGTPTAQQWLGPAALPACLAAVIAIMWALLGVRIAYYKRAVARMPKSPFQAPSSIALESDTLVCQAPGVSSRIALSAIADIIDGKQHLMIYLSPSDVITLTNATFESGALETFRAELMQRWKGCRGTI